MIDSLKASMLWLSDRLHFDPYEDFNRPFFPADPIKSLYAICTEAEDDLKAFEILGGRIVVNRLPRDGSIDTGDQATWHGIYTAMAAWRYSVKPNEATGLQLMKLVEGLRLHQPKIGRDPLTDDAYDGILCRGVKQNGTGGSIIQWDASNDSACGHLAGLWWAWKEGRGLVSRMTSNLIGAWATNIYQHDGALINPITDKPTEFGKLENGILTDPLRVTLLMAIYGAAYRMTGNNALFRGLGQECAERHHALIPYGKVRWWKFDNHNDLHRAAIQLRIMFESGIYNKWADEIIEGMKRLYAIGRRQENPWVCLLVMPCQTASGMDEFRAWVRGVLSEFSLSDKRWNKSVSNLNPANQKETMIFMSSSKVWRSPVVKFGGQLVSLQPLPFWTRGSQDFFWQRHPYSVVDWQGYGEGDTRHNMGDFLCAYWLARMVGVLDDKD